MIDMQQEQENTTQDANGEIESNKMVGSKDCFDAVVAIIKRLQQIEKRKLEKSAKLQVLTLESEFGEKDLATEMKELDKE